MGFYKQLSETIYYILRSLKMIFTKKNMFFILFIAVFVACCVFSNKVFADESVPLNELEGATLSGGSIVSSTRYNIYWFSTNDQNIYTITNVSDSLLYLFYTTIEPQLGTSYTYVTSINAGDSYDFVGNSNFILSQVNTSQSLVPNFSVTSRPINEYDNTIDSLANAISLDNLWGQFGVCLIALAVLFALGFLVVRKVLKKDSNYKG